LAWQLSSGYSDVSEQAEFGRTIQLSDPAARTLGKPETHGKTQTQKPGRCSAWLGGNALFLINMISQIILCQLPSKRHVLSQ